MSSSMNEKRKARRREILDQFSFYVSIPRLGDTRHRVKDISELGIGMELDTFGEFKLNKGEVCELHFYVNQSLFLPLHIEVMRELQSDTSQEVGAAFVKIDTPAQQTFHTLVKLVDQLSDVAVLEKS